MMDGHGQIARKNDGPREVPVPVLPVLKKSDILPELARAALFTSLIITDNYFM